MDRTAELDRLMRAHQLTARQVGRLVNRQPHTVRNWRSSRDRTIPAHTLELLRLKLDARVSG